MARDVGRLNRRVDDETYDGFLVQRIAEHVRSIDAMLRPTAHEIYIDELVGGVPADDALTRALAAVDARARELDSLLENRHVA